MWRSAVRRFLSPSVYADGVLHSPDPAGGSGGESHGPRQTKTELQRELDSQAADVAPTPAPVRDPLPRVLAGTAADPALDEQAPGWPDGTTRAHVRAASLALAESWAGSPPEPHGQPAGPPHQPSVAVPDVPAGTPVLPRGSPEAIPQRPGRSERTLGAEDAMLSEWAIRTEDRIR